MPVVDVVMFTEQKEGSESFVGTWLKRTGDAVSAFEPIVEISTDKVSMEIAATASGTVREILKAEGDPVAPEKFWRGSRRGWRRLHRLLPHRKSGSGRRLCRLRRMSARFPPPFGG